MINVSPLSLHVPYRCWFAAIITICHSFLDALSQGPLQILAPCRENEIIRHGALWLPKIYSQEPPTTMKLNHRYTPILANSSDVDSLGVFYLRLASSQQVYLRRLDSSLLDFCVACVYHELSRSYASVTTVRVHGLHVFVPGSGAALVDVLASKLESAEILQEPTSIIN